MSGSALGVTRVSIVILSVIKAEFARCFCPKSDQYQNDQQQANQHATNNPTNSACLQVVSESKAYNEWVVERKKERERVKRSVCVG